MVSIQVSSATKPGGVGNAERPAPMAGADLGLGNGYGPA